MLKDLINEGFGNAEKLNCSQKIFHGANIVYNLDMGDEAIKISSGFGGGMGIEDSCGAITGALMVLGKMFSENGNQYVKDLAKEIIVKYRSEMGSINCAILKENHLTEELGCKNIILKAAEILDEIISRELKA